MSEPSEVLNQIAPPPVDALLFTIVLLINLISLLLITIAPPFNPLLLFENKLFTTSDSQLYSKYMAPPLLEPIVELFMNLLFINLGEALVI